jgi:predicted dithiol-disulfide oxidoreductase (DUF899 family)
MKATMRRRTVTEHKTGTREEWLEARNSLLEREKELTRRNDELARERLELPWVPLEKEYSFETEGGTKTLAELFDGRSQLLVYHFMFGPEYDAGCSVCSSAADTFDGAVPHLNARDVTFLCISRAPLERLLAYKRRMGWQFPWVSSEGPTSTSTSRSRLRRSRWRRSWKEAPLQWSPRWRPTAGPIRRAT